jgi:hypothetical protein
MSCKWIVPFSVEPSDGYGVQVSTVSLRAAAMLRAAIPSHRGIRSTRPQHLRSKSLTICKATRNCKPMHHVTGMKKGRNGGENELRDCNREYSRSTVTVGRLEARFVESIYRWTFGVSRWLYVCLSV